jgi:DNA anti-recombination protein RmuC
MKLHELASRNATQNINRIFESYFGSKISFDQLSSSQARKLLGRVRGLIAEHQATPARHFNEKNPTYLKLMMMEQALSGQVSSGSVGQPAATKPIMTPADKSKMQQQTAQQIKQVQDPKLKSALDKSSKGQTLNPDEQKLVAGAALQSNESRQRRGRRLNESEVQQAQVVLAAQDMVDKMQGMLEDVSELQFKELPALVDSIKNQVGIDQATQFNTDVSGALTALMQSLQGTKQQLDSALGVVTGQAPATPAVPDLGAGAVPAAAADDLVGDVDDLDAAAADAAADLDDEPAAALGRERR